MIRKGKRRWKAKKRLLFTKYRLCRVWRRNQNRTVCPAKHGEPEKPDHSKRSKACMGYGRPSKGTRYGYPTAIRAPGSIRLGKRWKHCCLIEELLEGDSFYALVSHTGIFQRQSHPFMGSLFAIWWISYIHQNSPYHYFNFKAKGFMVCRNLPNGRILAMNLFGRGNHLSKRYVLQAAPHGSITR